MSTKSYSGPLNVIIALVFCYLLGRMVVAQGISALLWVPLGFTFGLFVTAQMFLPLILGFPRAIRLVAKRQMRPTVFGRILATPVIWFVALTVVGFLWPSAAEFLENNSAFNLGTWLGTIAIILSPLSKQTRSDFRADFDKAYRRFFTEPNEPDHASLTTHQKQVKAAVTIATNLYLRTIPGGEDAHVPLQFSLPDSRFRYLIFCFSAVATACVREMTNADAVMKDCVHLVATVPAVHVQDFFDGPVNPPDVESKGAAYLKEFCNNWSRYDALEKDGRNMEAIDLICTMIHTTESNVPAETADNERLGKMGLQLSCRLPTIQGAFIELANQ
jgi:hypothetical protein